MVSLEPLPATFALLQHNVASHAQWCADRGVQVRTGQVLRTGGASATNAERVPCRGLSP